MRALLAVVGTTARRFFARYLYGTSPWGTALLGILVALYGLLGATLFFTGVGKGATLLALAGFLLLATVYASLYYGLRQSRITQRLDAQIAHGDAERRLVDQLQQALLQRRLPTLSNLQLSATYVPAAHGMLIGGDWYDVFELPHGRIMFSIGDVAGHGIEAAVIMSRAREAIIAAALHDVDPGAVLTRANAALVTQDSKFCTAIYGHINPETLKVAYATAGHPPGIMMDGNGSLRSLDYDGLPLGILHEVVYPTFRVQAAPGSLLVFYTDGLVEYRRDFIEGERRLWEAVRDLATRQLDDPAHAIQAAILADQKPLDDVAILTIAFRNGKRPTGSSAPSAGTASQTGSLS